MRWVTLSGYTYAYVTGCVTSTSSVWFVHPSASNWGRQCQPRIGRIGDRNNNRPSRPSPSRYFHVLLVVSIMIQRIARDSSRLSPRSPLQMQGCHISRSLSMTTTRRVCSMRARIGLQAARGGAHLPPHTDIDIDLVFSSISVQNPNMHGNGPGGRTVLDILRQVAEYIMLNDSH